METLQCLWLAEKGSNELDSWLDQACILKIKMSQVNVILDEVFEAIDYFKVEISQLNFCLSFFDLLSRKLCLLIFKDGVMGER